MKTLYVLFDSQCALCRQCRRWLERQPAFIELRFLALQSEEIACRFPGIEQFNLRDQLVVISDEGAVYQGSHAWIMCLYALREYREWSQRLASPVLLPWARRACELVSDNRLSLSSWFKGLSDENLERELSGKAVGPCKSDCRCG
jgi:predicted DCC family thiol-disulfide oxidoreductase YuxK